MTEGVLGRIVQHRCSPVKEGLHRRPVPVMSVFNGPRRKIIRFFSPG